MTERSSAVNEGLLPCPFCGGEDLTVYKHESVGSWVACVSCGLETPTETGTTPDDATKYWNTRAPAQVMPDAVAAERERCAKIAVSFGDFTGSLVIKDIRVMCGRAIADKIRETPIVTSTNIESPHAG